MRVTDLDETPETAPKRRRIIQQPLRTERPLALIASDIKPLSALEARLKSAHPLISFPSFAHFLAEPPRREPWRAIVVARSGAWDPRLDEYVHKRGCIALYGLEEESYGWPESVARIRDLSELDAWFEQLDKPEPIQKKERAKRKQATPRVSKGLLDLTSSWLKPAIPVDVASATPPPESSPRQLSLSAVADHAVAPSKSEKPVQLELNIPPERGAKRGRPKGSGAKDRQGLKVEAGRAGRRPREEARPATTAQRRVQEQARDRRRTRTDAAADVAFTRLAAELGLVRASKLLAELRARARGVASPKRRG